MFSLPVQTPLSLGKIRAAYLVKKTHKPSRLALCKPARYRAPRGSQSADFTAKGLSSPDYKMKSVWDVSWVSSVEGGDMGAQKLEWQFKGTSCIIVTEIVDVKVKILNHPS